MEDLIMSLVIGCRDEANYKLLLSRIIYILKEHRQIEPKKLIEMLNKMGIKTYKQSKVYQNTIFKLKLLGLISLRRDKYNKKYYVYTPEVYYEKSKIFYQLLK